MAWTMTDNPVADFMAYDAEQQAELERLPKCCKCKKRIQDDYCYRINDAIYCEECHNEEFMVWTDDVME